MTSRNIILIGGPDSGKSNFIGGLWISLRNGDGILSPSGTAKNIKYIEDIVAHLHQGGFAPRTDKNQEAGQGDVIIPLQLSNDDGEKIAELIIPDISGEIWKNAVETNELEAEWMSQLEEAVGCLIFLRVLSPLNVAPLDWVNSSELMAFQGNHAEPTEIPTQVMLCEFLRFIELKLSNNDKGQKPRISVIVSAWDMLDPERSAAGPVSYLQEQHPLFAGRLSDLKHFDIRIFGMSIFGGNPEADPAYREKILNSNFRSLGNVVFYDEGKIIKSTDLTLPVAWAIGIRDQT